MAKIPLSTIKYLIEAEFETSGIVEKPDVIGAIFGQTEGLLGQDLDLRELQRTGRIGRIEVRIENREGKSRGKIRIPSSMDSSETALIAASLETVDRIGPFSAKIRVTSVRDVRKEKREYVLKRAKEILEKVFEEEIPSSSSLTERLKEEIKTSQITYYNGLPAGPNVKNSDEIIIVEGRADVLNLLRNGITNVVAIGGSTIPQQIIDLTKEKVTTLFVDGDRGGDLIIKEMLEVAEIDYIAKAPRGKEVEELSKKEIFKALREKVSVEEYKAEPKAKELREFIPRAQLDEQQSKQDLPSSEHS